MPQAQTLTASLVIFPVGVSKQQADAILLKLFERLPDDRRPGVAQTTEFNPDYGGVTIYQP